MSDVLTEICDAKRRRVAAQKHDTPVVDAAAAVPARPVRLGSFGIIAEVKRASPSAGEIDLHADPVAQAVAYARGGAAAVSVLTEEDRFGGSLEDLSAVRAAVDLPVLRKDFVVDEWQIDESRAAGADMVLVIVAALDRPTVLEFAYRIREHGMTPLVEVHGAEEMEVALDALDGGGILGVNARNLRTLEVDLSVWEKAAQHIPDGVVAVAESGVKAAADVARAAAAGYAGVLCGEALMRAADPGLLLREMLTAAGQ
jgi:indole-3-glycerol phosphate synthase